MSFHGLIGFFLALNSIPFNKYTTVYISIHLLKDTLFASEFGQLKIKHLYSFPI